MRNRKRWLAVLTAACMMVPSGTVFAAVTWPSDVTIGGDSSVEYDPEEITDFINMVLPIASTNGYDFTIDPFNTLSEFSDEYDPQYSVYFKTQTQQAKIALTDTAAAATADGKLYVVEQVPVEDADLNTELALLVTDDGSGLVVATGYSVWVPDTGSGKAPQGKFETLTTANISDYVEFDHDAASNTVDNIKLGRGNVNTLDPGASADPEDGVESVYDGKLYKDTYVELAEPYVATDYVTVDGTGAITALAAKVLYTNTSGNYTAVSNEGDLVYTKPVTEYINTSDEAKIINKASVNTLVTVTATLTQVGDLGLTDDDTFEDDATASIYLAVSDGTKEAPIVSDEADTPTYEAVMTYNMKGANDIAQYNVYQSGKNNDNGGHNYVRYIKQDVEYDEVAFNLTAVANQNASAEAAWKTYAAALNGASSLPKISVVYRFEEGEDAPTAQTLTFKQWNGIDLWLGDGLFTDISKLTSLTVVEVDGTEKNAITNIVDGGNGYVCVTWPSIVAAGHDETVAAGYKLRAIYDGTTYELTL